MFIKHYFQGSSSFSFGGCLPSGWIILLFSDVITLISENVFFDRKNFWRHSLSISQLGLLACACHLLTGT
ncbi:hypothetical protein L6164_017565 [Bauhinia variegata]|uniref:Uncharacterized protein n=1 Tax=Bauhinia variegata TaxID=167791 RepID=A0ACB9ND87_BAUVA|nr:hypothetical protein L6164_017565 [Bauhinia variegata]